MASAGPAPTAARVAIVGGGLGGLALAGLLRLQAPHLAVTVFERERRDQVRPRGQGYAIGLTPATLALLAPLTAASPALRAVLHNEANSYSAFCMSSPSGRPMVRLGGQHAAGQFVDRPALRNALLDLAGCGEGRVIFGKKLASFADRADRVDATFDDGTTATAELLVAADGANSAVRRLRFPEVKYADLGVSNIAGALPTSAAPDRLLKLSARGLVRLHGSVDGNTFMFFAYSPPEGERQLLWSLSYPGQKSAWAGRFAALHEAVDDEHDYAAGAAARNELREDAALRVLARFTPECAAAVRATPADNLFGPRQVSSLPLAALPSLMTPGSTATRVRLLGDAAHATTTHMGAGANAAFADAAALAAALVADAPESWPTSLATSYETAMLQRAKVAVEGSLRSTGMIHATGWSARVRDLVLSTVGFLIWPFIR